MVEVKKRNVKKFKEDKNTKTEIFLPMDKIPTTTHQMKKASIKNSKIVFYEPAELKAVRSKLEAHLSWHVPKQKHTTAIRLVVKWLFPVTGKHTDGEYKTTKPDCSNMIKLLEDVMTFLGFWTDDALISSLVVEKFWSEKPGIYICIEEL